MGMNTEETEAWFSRTLLEITTQALANEVDPRVVTGELAMMIHLLLTVGVAGGMEKAASMSEEERAETFKEAFGNGKDH